MGKNSLFLLPPHFILFLSSPFTIMLPYDRSRQAPLLQELINKQFGPTFGPDLLVRRTNPQEQLCHRLRLSRCNIDRCVYLGCPYDGLRKWQELPDDVFQIYQIEAGVARLLSGIARSGNLLRGWDGCSTIRQDRSDRRYTFS